MRSTGTVSRSAPTITFPLWVLVGGDCRPATIDLDGLPHAAIFRSRAAAEKRRRHRQGLVELPGPAVAAFILDLFDQSAEAVLFDPGQPDAFVCSRQEMDDELGAFRRR